MERVIVYIDGFNLYFGLRERGWRRYLWLNLQELARRLLNEGQTLVHTKYFTSRVKDNPEKVRRQYAFLEALEMLSNFSIFYGKYLINTQICPKCGNDYDVPSEKMTDVNIAVEMMMDAHQDSFDAAILISADSDLTGLIKAIRELFPAKRIIAAFPPNRESWEIKKAVNAYFTIGQSKFRKSQFPDKIVKSDGYVLERPSLWR